MRPVFGAPRAKFTTSTIVLMSEFTMKFVAASFSTISDSVCTCASSAAP